MLYSASTCLKIVSELTLACGNNSTSFPKVIGDVKGCVFVKSSRHPEMKIAFPVPLRERWHSESTILYYLQKEGGLLGMPVFVWRWGCTPQQQKAIALLTFLYWNSVVSLYPLHSTFILDLGLVCPTTLNFVSFVLFDMAHDYKSILFRQTGLKCPPNPNAFDEHLEIGTGRAWMRNSWVCNKTVAFSIKGACALKVPCLQTGCVLSSTELTRTLSNKDSVDMSWRCTTSNIWRH